MVLLLKRQDKAAQGGPVRSYSWYLVSKSQDGQTFLYEAWKPGLPVGEVHLLFTVYEIPTAGSFLTELL